MRDKLEQRQRRWIFAGIFFGKCETVSSQALRKLNLTPQCIHVIRLQNAREEGNRLNNHKQRLQSYHHYQS
jgi:hypothetical protein